MSTDYKVLRASILYFNSDPSESTAIEDAVTYFEDGVLIVKDGYIYDVGDYNDLVNKHALQEHDIDTRYQNQLILPGFIDTHTHYPQVEMIGSYGEQLLPWLNTYTFPTETKFKNVDYAEKIADLFIEELLRNGTTTALVLATVHPQSVDAIFKSADAKEMRLIAGKVMMDRNAPEELLDSAESGFIESEALIKKWHEKHRLLYAITPRFAPTSTASQLHSAGELKKRYPSTYVHTHLSENDSEIDWVKSLFPEAKNYLDVYKMYGLVTSKSIFAHAIHLDQDEYTLLHTTGAAVSFCPTSNLFLGSGLFKIREMKKNGRNVKIGMGTDVGAGTSLNMLQTLQEAYKVVSLEQNALETRCALSAFEGFYQATLGGAEALSLETKIGRLDTGYEADFVVLDYSATVLQTLRMEQVDCHAQSKIEALSEKLFALMMMGDDRNIVATYVNGKNVYERS